MAISTGAMLGAALIGAAGSFGSQMYGSAKSYKQNAALMGMQALLNYYYQRKLNQNAYQDTTYSMRQAGINPMLAINNGASAGSFSAGLNSANAPSGVDLDLTQAIQSAKQLENDTKRVENETDQTESLINKQTAETELNKSNKQSIDIQNSYAPIIKDAELNVLKSQVLANQAQATSSLIQARNNSALTASQVKNLNSSTINNINSAKGVQAAEIAKSNWIKEHPHLYSLGQTLQNIAPGMFAGAAGVGAGVGLYNAKTNRMEVNKPKPRVIGRRH